jgi:CRISPR-associated protein Cas2
MANRQLFLAAYDIRDHKRLYRALHILKDYTCGGQKSVFECYLTPSERIQLVRRVYSVMDETVDFFLIVPLRISAPVRTIGTATPPADEGFLYIG